MKSWSRSLLLLERIGNREKADRDMKGLIPVAISFIERLSCVSVFILGTY